MPDEEIHEKVQNVFRSVFEDPNFLISDELHAGMVPKWDSLLHITLITEVERAFSVRFRNAEIARLNNVGSLKALVGKHVRR
jgi:acyl carrier protein